MLEVRDLKISFGHRRKIAVNKISFDISENQRLGLIGESGCGKSVTALAIMGLLPENAYVSGSIKFNGEEILNSSDATLRKLRGSEISMVFQEPMTALDPTMKIGSQLSEICWLHNSNCNVLETVNNALIRVGFAGFGDIAKSYPHELSGGQRQRVLIAMAIMNNPQLVICDEPTTALDMLVQAEIINLLRENLGASLFITHDIAVMAQLCDSVAVMLDGEIVEIGEVRKVITDPKHLYTKSLIAAAGMQRGTDNRLLTVEDFMQEE